MIAPRNREPEIDGLRALAIVPVVLYHAGWTILPGGFVGVDIFFVISGYLITRILNREIEAGEFSLLSFYERRVRRIMPALFLVLAVTTIAATLFYLPEDLATYSRSLLSTILFGSNVYFFQNTGYFDLEANHHALLHTWSLAVEEQFYLVFPLVLFAAAKLSRSGRLWLVAIIGIASLGMSIVYSPIEPAFAFYLPFTRAWELMAGAMLAFVANSPVRTRWIRESVSGVSLFFILATILSSQQGVDFPGWIAAIPVLGAGGLLLFAHGTVVGRLLSNPILVGIGLISYSLYLWHWPLLVFANYFLDRSLLPAEGTALVLVAVPLAILTWTFVEQPFRRRGMLSRKALFAASAAGMALVAIVASAGIHWNGIPGRFDASVTRLSAFASDVSPKRETCHDHSNSIPPEEACVLGADVQPALAVWSDSHGTELTYALGELEAKQHRSVLQLTSSGCAPGLSARRGKCYDRNAIILAFLMAHPRLHTIVLTAFLETDLNLPKDFSELEPILAELRSADREVVFVYPTPRDGTDIPKRLAREQWNTGTFDPKMYSLSAFEDRYKNTLARLDSLVLKYGLIAVHPTDAYCPNGTCLAYRDGIVLYFDSHHPSQSGARLIARLVEDSIKSAAAANIARIASAAPA